MHARPTANKFCWFELRTTDPTAARAFYADAARLEINDVGGRIGLHAGGHALGEITVLPARAAALGAPPHWLGHVGVADVEAAAGRFVALGATPLGPNQRRDDGSTVAVLRDPVGAVMAVTTGTTPAAAADAIWCELHSRDRAHASAIYASMFGWTPTAVHDLGPALGAFQEFAWHAGGRSVGSMTSAAQLPGIHTHWLFYLRVEDIAAAVARVRACGGRVVSGPVVVAGGAGVAVCEDPQGAAFGLREVRAPRPVAFVCGHLDLTGEEFEIHYAPQIAAACERGCRFVVGDARGADLLFQRYAHARGLEVTVFHMLERPRNNAGAFPTVGGFTSDAARDEAMTAASSLDIAWVRPGRERSGTARNLQRRSRAAT